MLQLCSVSRRGQPNLSSWPPSRRLNTVSDRHDPVAQTLMNVRRYLPPETQVVLVSATLPHEVLEMTHKFMTDPVRILVKRDELTLEVRSLFVSVHQQSRCILCFRHLSRASLRPLKCSYVL